VCIRFILCDVFTSERVNDSSNDFSRFELISAYFVIIHLLSLDIWEFVQLFVCIRIASTLPPASGTVK